MPRKPTSHARNAREELLSLATTHPPTESLPPLRELGKRFAIHPSTVFRILSDLVSEGFFWKSPTGRFYPSAGRQETLRGAPLCFIGREMWQWSRLYQEILEGVSEVCSANGSPLILLSSRSLVRQNEAEEAPGFASAKAQVGELDKIAKAIPRGCAGFLLDHLWHDSTLKKVRLPGGECVQLLRGSGRVTGVVEPNYGAAARLAVEFAKRRAFKRIGLVIPFSGDPAIDLMVSLLRESFDGFGMVEIGWQELLRQPIRQGLDLLVCPEDNIALAVAHQLASATSAPMLLATQGTGVITAPHARLRIDYRRLGRTAAARILHGTGQSPTVPLLVVPERA